MKLAVDIDNTLYPILLALAEIEGGSRVSYDLCYTYEAVAELVDDPSRIKNMFKEAMLPERSIQIGCFQGAGEVLSELSKAGVEIHVMTKRSEDLRPVTEAWLDALQIPYDHLHLQDPFDKTELCLRLGIQHLIDDEPDTIKAAYQAGIQVYSLAYPYNRQILSDLKRPLSETWLDLSGALSATNCFKQLTSQA